MLIKAYRWGNLTGGRATRAFSLMLLLPFMRSNIAIWMLPPAAAGSRATCWLLAGTLTAMYVLSVTGVAVDLVAGQCAADPRCTDGRWSISWLAGEQPGQRVALTRPGADRRRRGHLVARGAVVAAARGCLRRSGGSPREVRVAGLRRRRTSAGAPGRP